MISTMKANKLLRQGCVGHWCYAIAAKEEEVKVRNIIVVCQFPNVFPKELLGLPIQQEIDFETELISDAQPILKLHTE